MAKLVPSTTEFWVGDPPAKCDVCEEAIMLRFVDGKTVHGPWANMCPRCHKEVGCGLGVGRGQCYQRDMVTGKWAKLVPAVPLNLAKRKQPSQRTLEKWSMDGVARATDGCTVEPDGVCPHGSKSWLLELGLV